MTLHNRSPAHRQINARQKHGGLFPFPGAEDPSSTDTPTDTPSATPSQPTSSPPPPPATSNKPTRSNTPPPNTPKPTPSPTPTPTTDSQSSTKHTSTSSDPPTSVSNTETSTSIRSVNSSTSKTAGTGALTITGPPKTLTQTNAFGTFTPTVTDDSSASISSSVTPSASSGISTGAIVGSVAGGIAAIALIGLIIAFFLRRWRRNRITDEDFNPDEFVRSADMSDTGYRASTFDPVPPSMAHRGHVVSPSIGSTNMAGQGAYPYNASAGVQERQMYYDQGYDANGGADDGSEMARGGPYSSQPQPQAAYNPEAYGSYAYTTDGHHAVSSQAYHPYSSQEYQAHYQDNAAPALVAGAPAVPAGRAAHVVNHDDAYGGI